MAARIRVEILFHPPAATPTPESAPASRPAPASAPTPARAPGSDGVTEVLVRGAHEEPSRTVSLTRAEVGRLGRAILSSIRYTLARFTEDCADAGDGAIVYVEENRKQNPFKVYGRAGEPCPRRNGTIRRIVQAGRSTFLCEACVAPRAAR